MQFQKSATAQASELRAMKEQNAKQVAPVFQLEVGGNIVSVETVAEAAFFIGAGSNPLKCEAHTHVKAFIGPKD